MDRLDDLLAAHFTPEAAPPGLASRVLTRARGAEDDARKLLDEIEIGATDRGVCLIRSGRLAPPASAQARRLAERAREELAEYLEGRRTFFSVPVDLSAVAPFQRAVLAVTSAIPFGEARSYAWVAARIGHPGAARAVGTALARNPVPLIVPCHRVLRGDGGVGGYLFGTRIKDRLLALEQTTPTLIGCTSTRILCRRGCRHEQRVREDRRVVFASVREGRAVGYRACRVCRPERSLLRA
ncbi:MAG: methylated-DNA--[protein]-cysteine S-methyltransferase [Candidatus Rokubacteria bacterium]|nr:methylated-DNA--[protein]-cysteine S-methyltransferase [Candidatus Rokubacteria bacterium]